MRGLKELHPTAMNNAGISQDYGGVIRFETPDAPGAGIFVVPIEDPVLAETSVILQIDYLLESGQIYADLVSDDWQTLTQHPQGGGRTGSIYLFADVVLPGLKVMIGVQAGAVRGEIIAISVIPKTSVSPAEFKRMRAQGFPFWYAEADLGDGVIMPASIPPESMAGTRRSHAIMVTLMQKVIAAPLTGLRGIDVGCSSGYHSLQLARLGASMTGIDPFDHGIAQARFVEECVRDSLPASVEFRRDSIYSYKPDDQLDFFYCVGVLYHLEDPIGALRRLYDLCRIGGVIGCCVSPTRGDFFELSDATKYGFCQPTECTLVPTASALRRCCEHVGFKVIEMADWSEFEDFGAGEVRHVPKEIDVPIGPVYYAVRK